ncbi:MAG: GNAT family N-acetyltransferase, partial [Lapillicoccus sp.]
MTSGPRPSADLLPALERYYDAAPGSACDTEDHGALTLFVPRSGFPYYARPTLGWASAITPHAVTEVLHRQRELDLPRALEWVHESTPSLLAAARAAGMNVEECPLLVLDREPVAPTRVSGVRLVPADDPALPLVRAAVNVGFRSPGTAVGPASTADRDAQAATRPESGRYIQDLVAAGLSVLAGAFDPEAGPVGGGNHNPRGDVTEIVGVAVLPAFRRRGLAAALTALLARDALEHGVQTV